jgi:hypothetical protein
MRYIVEFEKTMTRQEVVEADNELEARMLAREVVVHDEYPDRLYRWSVPRNDTATIDQVFRSAV